MCVFSEKIKINSTHSYRITVQRTRIKNPRVTGKPSKIYVPFVLLVVLFVYFLEKYYNFLYVRPSQGGDSTSQVNLKVFYINIQSKR